LARARLGEGEGSGDVDIASITNGVGLFGASLPVPESGDGGPVAPSRFSYRGLLKFVCCSISNGFSEV
jgi:hypothetical protein